MEKEVRKGTAKNNQIKTIAKVTNKKINRKI